MTILDRVEGSADSSAGEPGTAPPAGGLVDHHLLSTVLARFAGTLIGRFTLDDVMSQLGCDIRMILGVAGAGVMTGDDDGQLHFVTSSHGVLAELESLQMELDEGPCLMSYRTGETVFAPDLSTDLRFPGFGPRAVAAGMHAVHSFPMEVDGTRVGALNLYAGEPGALSEQQIAVSRTFADVATAYLIHARDLQQRDVFTEDLQRALTARVIVEQAKGYIAARREVSTTEAFELIRRYARGHRVRVQMVARSVVEGDLDTAELAET